MNTEIPFLSPHSKTGNAALQYKVDKGEIWMHLCETAEHCKLPGTTASTSKEGAILIF